MTFAARLTHIAGLVERRLEELLTEAGAPAPKLAEAMRYATLGGGKRFRPFLAIECAGLFGVDERDALDTAAAIECLHCYSLVHDDLPAMDDDALRRGRATVHIAYDEATAILVGDALLTLTFEILARAETHDDAGVRAELIRHLAESAGWLGMAAGQALDLDAEGSPAGADAIARIQALKTGKLITFACEAGAVLGRADETARARLKAYGNALGMAFQLADDLLDVEGDAEQVGKATGKDAAAGKATLIAALGLEAARARLDELEARAIAELADLGERADALREATRFVTRRTH